MKTSRIPTNSERKLANIAIELAIFASQYMKDKSIQEVAEWAAKQLNECGFKNEPIGSNWAYLLTVEE